MLEAFGDICPRVEVTRDPEHHRDVKMPASNWRTILLMVCTATLHAIKQKVLQPRRRTSRIIMNILRSPFTRGSRRIETPHLEDDVMFLALMLLTAKS
ncbi:hypothetical protein [Enterocloster sp.]|uniref:hypothetical protein n=1 Tax=Enterocloster sp. TaxID=2719315 RepID=UPI0039A31896